MVVGVILALLGDSAPRGEGLIAEALGVAALRARLLGVGVQVDPSETINLKGDVLSTG